MIEGLATPRKDKLAAIHDELSPYAM